MWTYSGSTTKLDEVRFWIGDTCSTDQLVQDELIFQSLNLNGSNSLRAAIAVADQEAARVSRSADSIAVGDLRIQKGMQADGWRNVGNELRKRRAHTANAFTGGLGKTDKETRQDDTTINKPFFTRTMFSHNDGTTST